MKTLATIICCTLLLQTGFSQSVETRIMVRAKAKDAKFIGSSMGGAQVNISNADTGELLANGIITGSTGNTDVIMKTAHERGKQLSDTETAGYEAVLQLSKPVLAHIEVLAPLGQRQSIVKSGTQVWLIPGKHILGDGIVLEFPGFVVDIQSPGAQSFIKQDNKGKLQINISAHLVMMCGCTITKDGLWNANNYEVQAVLSYKGKKLEEIKMRWVSDNQYEAQFEPTEKGVYEFYVYAYDPATGNTGVDFSSFIVQ